MVYVTGTYSKSVLNDSTGQLREEEEVLQWLITQKTEDRIELITRAMLETMVEETTYLAVYFCKLYALHLPWTQVKLRSEAFHLWFPFSFSTHFVHPPRTQLNDSHISPSPSHPNTTTHTPTPHPKYTPLLVHSPAESAARPCLLSHIVFR